MKAISTVLIILLFSSMFASISCIGQAMAIGPVSEGSAREVLDFNNGTKELIVDYLNGTRNCISETFVKKTAQLVLTDETGQTLTLVPTEHSSITKGTSLQRANALSSTPADESADYTNVTQTMVVEQQMMLGFTYTLAYWQEQWTQQGGWWIFSWYLTVGVDIDIQFGLRLPINVTLEYPDHMTIGNNYTIHATLDPIDKPGFDELLLTCRANIWAQAGLVGIEIPRTVLIGPDFDNSQSFVTPLGSGSTSLPPEVRVDIFNIIKTIVPSSKPIIDIISKVVVPYLEIHPSFGSNLIEAMANASGDARVVEGATLNWSEPHQTKNFTVYADEYDPATNYSRLVLSDFKYFFTKLGVDFALELDFVDAINWFNIPDPVLHIYTFDISWITKFLGTPFVSSHSGYPGSIYLSLCVERILDPAPQYPAPEDVAISYAYAFPPKVLFGNIANITVGAKNLGNVSETFNVTIFADDTALNVTSIVELGASEEVELNFAWDTNGFAVWHTYNITVEASPVANESDLDNNVLSAGTVEIVLEPPNANFTYSPVPPIQNQTATFNASVSTPGSGPIITYEWDFGEGTNFTTSDPIVVYVFAYYGNHKITLTVTDSNGLNSTFLEVVNVTSNGRPGDVNGDGQVDIYDAVVVATSFGSTPGEPRWNSAADTNQDGKCDILDTIPIGMNFGRIYT